MSLTGFHAESSEALNPWPSCKASCLICLGCSESLQAGLCSQIKQRWWLLWINNTLTCGMSAWSCLLWSTITTNVLLWTLSSLYCHFGQSRLWSHLFKSVITDLAKLKTCQIPHDWIMGGDSWLSCRSLLYEPQQKQVLYITVAGSLTQLEDWSWEKLPASKDSVMEKMDLEDVDSALMEKGKKPAAAKPPSKFERLYQPCLAEIVGTMFFVFIGCVSVIENVPAAGRLQPALVHGLAVAVMVAVMDNIR